MKTPSDHLHRDFHQMLVAAVHGISGLEGSDTRPALFKKHGPRLGRADIEVRVFDRIFAFAQHHDPSGQVDIPLIQHLRHAGMLRIGGAIDVLGLDLLVDRIFLANLHDGENVAGLRVDERDLLLGMDAVGKVLVDGKRDRDRPEDAAGQFHIQARTAPVVVPHEPIERRIGPHCQHEHVGDRT